MLRLIPLVLIVAFVSNVCGVPLRPVEQRLPEQKPIPQESGALIDRDYQQLQKRWALKQLLKPAQERWKNKPWAAEATALTERALDLFCTATVIKCAMGPVAGDFRKLLATGADDPLLLTLAAQAYYDETFDWRPGRPLLERALAAPSLPPAVQVLALRFQIPMLMIQGANYRYVRGTLVDAMTRAVDDGTYQPKDEVVFVRHQIAVMDLVEVTMPSYLTNWQAKIAASTWPAWVKLTLQGFGDVELAWLERSDDWAVEVKDAQWEGFAKHLKNAREHLTKAWEANPARPEAAAIMITVTMGDGGGTPNELRLWLDRAAKAQLDYQPAYNSMIWALRPRWCGSHEAMLSFGLACAATSRFDLGVPNQLFCAAMDVADEFNDAHAVFRNPDVRSELAKISQGYLSQQGLPPQVRHLRQSNAALTAWLAGDAPLALTALKDAGPKLHYCTHEFMRNMLIHEALLRGEVKAGAGVFGVDIQAISELIQSIQPESSDIKSNSKMSDGGTSKEQAQKISALIAGTAPASLPSDEAREYLLELKDRQELHANLDKGGWVKITPRQHLISWLSTGGHWSVDKDGTLIAQGDDATWAALALNVVMAENLELRSEMRFENESNVEISPKGTGFSQLVSWQPAVVGEPEDGLRLMLMRGPGGDERSMVFRKIKNARESSITSREWNSFSTRVAHGKASCTLNDVTVFEEGDLQELDVSSPKGRIGFAVHRLPVGTKLRIRNIEVRKIDSAAVERVAEPVVEPAEPAAAKASPTTAEPPIATPVLAKLPAPVPAPQAPAPAGIPWKYLVFATAIVLLILTFVFVKPKEV